MIDRKDWEDAAQAFECSLMILRKDKNGWVIGFSVHPNEVPASLLDAPLGSRFQAVLFQVGDDEKPVVLEEVRDGKKAIAMAGELCMRTSFQEFILGDKADNYGNAEEQVAQSLRLKLKINSRSELATNKEAKEAFWEMVREYNVTGWGEIEVEEDVPF